MTALGGAMNGLQPSHGHLTNKDGGMKPTMMGVEQDITEIVYGDMFKGYDIYIYITIYKTLHPTIRGRN